jgi:hypothetical protein
MFEGRAMGGGGRLGAGGMESLLWWPGGSGLLPLLVA